MTTKERSLLQALDRIVQSQDARARIRPIVERVRAELNRKKDALMTWEAIDLAPFGTLPPQIRSGWVFVLRAGEDTGAERHPNSHQRMMTYGGEGDMQIDIKQARSDVENESEIRWQSNMLVSHRDAPLESRWISIPPSVWHRPVIPKDADWTVVSFHTVPAKELIEERPGAKQMRYLGSESKVQ